MSPSERIARVVMRHRIAALVFVLLATGVFATQIPKVPVVSILTDLFPSRHEFVEAYVEYQDVFGGANAVLIDIEVQEGDIFKPAVLEKIRAMTKELELLPGINNYQVLSLAQRKVKNITVDAAAGFQAQPLMWPEIPQTPEEVERLRDLVHSGRVHGTLVSSDDKAALILAGFYQDQLNPTEVYERLHELAKKIEDDNTSVHMIGRPIMLGFIAKHSSQLTWLFVLTVLAMITILAINFRDLTGVLVPTLTAVLSSVWGLGLLGFLGYNFDPIVLVVPFIISARALSHSVQLIERYHEEWRVHRDTRLAAERTLAGLWEPGFVGIMADVLAMLVVWLTYIPLMQKLAIMASFWGFSIVFSDLVFNPVLLSFLPPPTKVRERSDSDRFSRIMGAIGRFTIGPHKWTILAGAGVLFVAGFLAARTVVIGDVYPGTPMLWPSSEYNQDTDAIGRKFGNTDILNVFVQGDAWNAIKSPDVLNKMWFLQREMASMPEVGGTSSIADYIPPLIRAMHGGDPRWELIPTDGRESGFFLEMIYSASEPGDLSRFVTPDSRHANISIYLKDHRGETLRKVVERLRSFVAENPIKRSTKTISEIAQHVVTCVQSRMEQCPTIEPGARFRLAGGYAGLLAAINEVVMQKELMVTLLAFLAVFLICAFSYRSVLAGLFFMIPLVVSNYLTYALMGLRGIGLDVNTLPIVALGVGLGVDYGLYVVSRIMEEYKAILDLGKAIEVAMATAGKAVVLTAATMVAGVFFWSFSFLRFQADMGLLLVFWMSMSMVGSLLLLPNLIYIFRPRFVLSALTTRDSLP